MWDEKKFFEDFKKESGRVEPDPAFVDKMVNLVNASEKTKVVPVKRKQRMFQAAAAVLVVCGVGFGVMNLTSKTEKPGYQPGIHAGKNPNEDGPLSGSFGEEKGKVSDVFKMEYPKGISKAEVVADTAKEYHVQAGELDVRIQPVNFEKESEILQADASYRRGASVEIGKRQMAFVKQYELYDRVPEDEAGFGVVLLFADKKTGTAYRISVTGTGTQEAVAEQAEYVLNHFKLLS